MNGRTDILGLRSSELDALARSKLSRGGGIGPAVFRAAHTEGRFDPESLGLGEQAVRAWREHFELGLLEVVRVVQEPFGASQTQKAVMRTKDGLEVECVHIPMGPDRSTLCISSQVGCRLACTFCETGRMGLLRSLNTAEIVSQVVTARSVLSWPIRNIVFQGMGEPLDNVEAVVRALQVLGDTRGLNIGQQRFCVCTAGVPDGIRRLGELRYRRMDLSISLNAATDEKRRRIMPITAKHPLAEVQQALLDYPRRKNFVFGVHYCLLPGINDTAEDIDAVVEFCRPLERVMINLIPYNPGSIPLTRAPESEEIEAFASKLHARGLPVRERITKGRTVMAGCGQLGNIELRRRLVVR